MTFSIPPAGTNTLAKSVFGAYGNPIATLGNAPVKSAYTPPIPDAKLAGQAYNAVQGFSFGSSSPKKNDTGSFGTTAQFKATNKADVFLGRVAAISDKKKQNF